MGHTFLDIYKQYEGNLIPNSENVILKPLNHTKPLEITVVVTYVECPCPGPIPVKVNDHANVTSRIVKSSHLCIRTYVKVIG